MHGRLRALVYHESQYGKMGEPAARGGELHVCSLVTGVIPHVGGPVLRAGGLTTLMGGMPATRVSDCASPPDCLMPWHELHDDDTLVGY